VAESLADMGLEWGPVRVDQRLDARSFRIPEGVWDAH